MGNGERVGRYVMLRDLEGRLHALSPNAVCAICDNGEGGSVLMLPGGKFIQVEREVEQVAAMLSGLASRLPRSAADG